MSVTAELNKELETYEKHKENLLGTSKDKYVLIHGSDILGTYESEQDAINEGYRQLGNVPFLVKRIVEVEIPVNFVSRNVAI